MKRKRAAFTLIEMLVVLMILSTVLILTTTLIKQTIHFRIQAYEVQAIQEQQRYALLQIEQDVRKAADVEMPQTTGGASLQYERLVLKQNHDKRMSDKEVKARIIYGLKPDNTPKNNLTGIPKAQMVLYKKMDTGKGQADPVAMYLNPPSDDPEQSGMVVEYFDRSMAPCGIDAVTSYVHVRFNTTSSTGDVVSMAGTFPLTAKEWYEGV